MHHVNSQRQSSAFRNHSPASVAEFVVHQELPPEF